MDVLLPPKNSGSLGNPKRRNSGINRQSPHTLKLDWKLPARLREPVLKKNTRVKSKKLVTKGRNSVAGMEWEFERREIRSDLIEKRPSPQGLRYVGSEKRSGDIKRNSFSEMEVSAPPYLGIFIRKGSTIKNVRPGIAPVKNKQSTEAHELVNKPFKDSLNAEASPHVLTLVDKDVGKKSKKNEGNSRTELLLAGFGERDIPYIWAEKAHSKLSDQAVAEKIERNEVISLPPKRWFQFGLHSSPDSNKNSQSSSRVMWMWPRPLAGVNVVVLLLGCALLSVLIWQLQGVNVFISVARQNTGKIDKTFTELMSAGAAVASTDWHEGEKKFASAQELLSEIQRDLDNSIVASDSLIVLMDVTGSIQSGQSLLEAGSSLTEAGERIAHGFDLITTAGTEVINPSNSENLSMTAALEAAKSDFNVASAQLADAEKSLARVKINRLPEGADEHILILRNKIPLLRSALDSFLDKSDMLLALLGAKQDKQYLFVFQNNHELRPSGGFIGSIGLMDIDRGKVESIDVQSVYDGDGQLKEYISPPFPLLAVTNRWYLRDANWFVNFPVTARKIASFFEKEGGPTVDGVLALTPEVIRELVNITGPIDVPNYDVQIDYENFWEITQDQVTYSYDEELNKPKQFLADLTPILLAKLMGEPKNTIEIINLLMRMMEEKQLQVYFADSDAQEILASNGWSGETPKDGQGFLAINNANIAGHKSDQFIEQDIDYSISINNDGNADVVVQISRSHRGPVEASDYEFPKDENPALKNNIIWQRMLVPQGAELISAQGFNKVDDVPKFVEKEDLNKVLKPDEHVVAWQSGQIRHSSGTVIGQEAGYSFFGNWLVTEPGQTSIATYQYRIPDYVKLPTVLDPASSVEAMVFKQPGDMRSKVRVTIQVPDSMYIVHTVPEAGITRISEREVVYRGAVKRDIITGIVLEKK